MYHMFMPFEERILYVHVLFNTIDIISHDFSDLQLKELKLLETPRTEKFECIVESTRNIAFIM